MSLFNKKPIKRLLTAAVSALILSTLVAPAYALTGFNRTAIYSFGSEEEKVFTSPDAELITAGGLSWNITDTLESKINRDGLYIAEGFIKLKAANPVNAFSGFKLEIVYSSDCADSAAEGTKAFFVASTKKYNTTQLVSDTSTVLGIAENGDVYYKGQKINHENGEKAGDIITAKNSAIKPGEECKLQIKYINQKLSVTLFYNSGKNAVKLVENFNCEISKLQQLILGGDKVSRLEKMTYKSLSAAEYGEYLPHIESNLKAIVQNGESIKEYNSADTALAEALKLSSGGAPVLKLYSDLTLKTAINIPASCNLSVDLNGHTISRNLHSTMTDKGYVFSVGEGASLKITDSSPDSTNYSTAIKGGVITGGAGDDCGGGIQLNAQSKLVMTGGNIVGCITNDHGGAIRVDDSAVKISISNAGFYSNMTLDSADNSHGGAIYSDYSDCEVSIKNSIFEGNYSEDNGGAIYINDGSFYAENCIFNANKCLDEGGAVYVEKDSKASFENCVFTNNISGGHAGALYCNSSDGTRICGTFTGNSAGKVGGAIFINGDKVSILNSTVTGNKAKEKAGGIYVDEMYDINTQGLLIIRGNKNSKNENDDLYLDYFTAAEAMIYNGGLEPGSEVRIKTGDSNHTVSKNISSYQRRYFFSDDSTMSFVFNENSAEAKSQKLISSAIGGGSIVFVIITAAAVLIAALIIAVVVNKKKGAVKR